MDIDIDFADAQAVKKLFKDRIVLASQIENDDIKKHNVGVYFQTIPIDKELNIAAIPCLITGETPRRDRAGELGYIKIDLLEVKLLQKFKSKSEIRQLLKIDPDWTMLENENIVQQLFQIRKHFDVVSQVRPKSIQELADVLALIRPNKRKLLDEYIKDPVKVRENLLYKREEGEKSSFRMAHALPYSMLIILNLHYINAYQPINTFKE